MRDRLADSARAAGDDGCFAAQTQLHLRWPPPPQFLLFRLQTILYGPARGVKLTARASVRARVRKGSWASRGGEPSQLGRHAPRVSCSSLDTLAHKRHSHSLRAPIPGRRPSNGERWKFWALRNHKLEEQPMTDYKYENVKVRVRDGIAWTALNRPDKRNAMSPGAALRDGRRARAARSRRRRQGRGGDRRGRQFQRRPGPEEVLPRAGEESGRAQEGAGRRQSLALGAALRLRQADHRHGARLLRRRRVHAAAGLRLRDRRRERDLLALGGELGDSARRAGVQGGRRHGAAAPRALLRLPGRAVRRQGGRAHRHGQLSRCRPKSSRRPPSSSPKS